MTRQERKEEILSQMTAFSKERYAKSEYLPELSKLKEQAVLLTFGESYADKDGCSFYDVQEQLIKMNDEKGGICTKELENFKKLSRDVSNAYYTENCGSEGERRVFNILKTLSCENALLKNIELRSKGVISEIDTIVITNRAVFNIEVKNCKNDIYINADGDYSVLDDYMLDKHNVKATLDSRRRLVLNALQCTGIRDNKHIMVYNIIVSANPHSKITSKYRYLKALTMNNLAKFIENFHSDKYYTYEEICTMKTAIEDAEKNSKYSCYEHFNSYKSEFAEILAKLEIPEQEPTSQPPESEFVETEVKHEQKAVKIPYLHTKTIPENDKPARKVIIAAAVLIVCGLATSALYKYGNKFIR